MTNFRAALLFLISGSVFAQDDYQPRNTQAPGEEPPTAQEAADLITVPDGFQVKLFAGDPDVRQPVAMALDDRGRLFVAESYSYKEWKKTGEDRVLIFEDTDNDGVHDSRKIFTSGIDHLSGMTVGWGGVWVCSAPNLLFYPDKNRDDIPDGEPEIILDGWTTEAGHNFFNGLTWGPDGWLYGRHGITRPSFVGKPGTPEDKRIGFDCAIWRYHPVTEEFEVVCRGTTNPWGLDWNEAGDMFFTNNVNGHLWHAIPGAFYPRMGERNDAFAKFVYDRIGMCCDHLHHAGAHTDWTKTRDGKGVHGELGGGHSHCGGMIYLGGKWPEKYRGRIFMCNTHGRRVNVDRLERQGSGYVGKHDPDFLQANNVWFRGVQMIYGPDGDVYLSDWVDNGECHDNDGVHRTSGRIYKIIHGKPSPPVKFDLWKMSSDELGFMQAGDNEWLARRSRLVLQHQKFHGGGVSKSLAEAMWQQAKMTSRSTRDRIRALQTLQVIGELRSSDPKLFEPLFSDENEYVRSTAVRYASEHRFAQKFAEMAKNDPSLHVQLSIASVLRKYSPYGDARGPLHDGRLKVAEALAGVANHADDPNLPLMIWFGVREIASNFEPTRPIPLLDSKIPLLQKQIARYLAENGKGEAVISQLSEIQSGREEILAGLLDGLKGQKFETPPESWLTLKSEIKSSATVDQLDLILNRKNAIERQREMLSNATSDDNAKQQALALLGKARDKPSIPVILTLLENENLQSEAIMALANFNDPQVAEKLITNYQILTPAAKPQVINTLAANKTFASALLDALEKKTIPRHAVAAFHARQILTFKDDALKKKLAAVWGKTGSSSAEKKAEIKKWQNQLLPDVLAKADLKNGKAKYQQLCSACHNLHGEGGAIGPELTGANRGDLYYLLENIIDPSATLPADFRMTVITKKDGTTVSGTVNRENEYAITIGTLTDEVNVDLADIKKRETLEQSIMPEGLLGALSDDDVRDLIAFLQK